MAYNVLEELKNGNFDFVFHCTPYDYDSLIKTIRNAKNRIEIINGFLPKLKKKLPSFCFNIIYDIPEFIDDLYELLDIKEVTPLMIYNLLNNSSLGLRVLYENFDYFLNFKNDEKYFDYIVKYAFDSNNRNLIFKLSRYSNLHIRYKFMDYLINNYPEQSDIIYDDITKYTTSITYEENEQLTLLPELMSPSDISNLAVSLLVNNREKDYYKLMKIILKNYKYNYLASLLLEDKWVVDPNKDVKERTFCKNADILFNTSIDYKFNMYLRHKSKISDVLLNDFAYKLRYFLGSCEYHYLESIYNSGLGLLLEEWTTKYMDISKNKEYGYIGGGSTCNCFRIGDYVIKLVKTKWSYESIICPNLYLIAKNYEEIYIRDENNIVIGGLEVQKYLTRRTDNIDPKYFNYFDLELNRLGYIRTDTLTKGTCGENTMLLDTYRDADCVNPEKVPVWFKECPLVLIDRDRIYPKDEMFIKQLRNSY